jgi:hypothetical protein
MSFSQHTGKSEFPVESVPGAMQAKHSPENALMCLDRHEIGESGFTPKTLGRTTLVERLERSKDL